MISMTNIDYHAQQLIERLNSRSAIIGIIGLGYVGLPLALTYCEAGYKVIGFDIDSQKIESIKSGISYFKHIPSERIKAASIEHKLFIATSEFKHISECNALIICVPTPLGNHNEPDIQYIHSTMQLITSFVRAGQIISLESTTYPGTTEEVLKPWLEDNNFTVGKDVFLIFSPEREDPGNIYFDTSTIPKVLGGVTQVCGLVGESLYRNIIDKVVRVGSAKAAEMTKLLENIHRAVNIGLVNEMKIVAHSMGIDIFEVIEAAATKPFGFAAYYPGPGLGGHCIPIDPFYLTWKAKEYGVNTKFIELAGEINSNMPNYVIERTVLALNQQKKSISGSNLLIIGIAYKKNIDDCRESPSIAIINKLIERGADVLCYDPYFTQLPNSKKWKRSKPKLIKSLYPELLESMDACLICTDHDNIDYKLIEDCSTCIIDTRGRYKQSGHIYSA